MPKDKTTLIIPILLVALGCGWLLATLKLAPQILWIWTLGLAAVGILTFLIGGFDKVTVVIGPFFLATSLLSVLRQTGRLRFDVEVPILVIVLGALLLVAHLPAVPVPRWFGEDGKKPKL